MPELKRPNLHSQRATTGAAFVTVYANRSDVGISEAAFERMGASDEHYLTPRRVRASCKSAAKRASW